MSGTDFRHPDYSLAMPRRKRYRIESLSAALSHTVAAAAALSEVDVAECPSGLRELVVAAAAANRASQRLLEQAILVDRPTRVGEGSVV
jgi:hypothetical protein